MKKICKVMLAAAAVVALAVPAMGADKLIVKNAGGTADVFKVSDTGVVTTPGLTIAADGQMSASNLMFKPATKKFGFGTTNPLTSLHISEPTAPFDRGLTISQYAAGGAAAIINIKKASGTEAAPGVPGSGANIGAFHALAYDGNIDIANSGGYTASASLIFTLDPGTYSQGNAPMNINFWTGANQNVKLERMRIASDGRLRLSNHPAAPANNATCTVGDLILDAPNGFLYVCSATNSWKRTSFTAY